MLGILFCENVLTRTECVCGDALYGKNVLDGTENSFCGKDFLECGVVALKRHFVL